MKVLPSVASKLRWTALVLALALVHLACNAAEDTSPPVPKRQQATGEPGGRVELAEMVERAACHWPQSSRSIRTTPLISPTALGLRVAETALLFPRFVTGPGLDEEVRRVLVLDRDDPVAAPWLDDDDVSGAFLR